jgi:hypothetical protein
MPRLLVLVVFLLVGWVLCPSLPAQNGKEVKAVVQEIDATVGTMAVILEGRKTHQVKTFNLARPDLPVSDGSGKALKLADVEPGQRVYLHLADDDVTAIRLAAPSLYGTVERVSVSERRVVLKSKIGERTIVLPESAKVIAGGEPARLEDVKAGQAALVVFSPDQRNVVELRTGRGVAPPAYLAKAVGVLIDVDRPRRTVQILNTSSKGDTHALRELPLAKEATFGLFHGSRPFRELTLDEVTRGVKVAYWTDTGTRKLVHLDVEMPTLGRRLVKRFDAETRQLVLDDPDGDKVLTLAPNVKVQTPAGTGKLDDIRPKANVSCGLSPDRKLVELVRVLAK